MVTRPNTLLVTDGKALRGFLHSMAAMNPISDPEKAYDEINIADNTCKNRPVAPLIPFKAPSPISSKSKEGLNGP
ncbi:hypothetical protein WICPIJ_008515 [Wickerhamomyces pijperi]|uniref:Uncharacterized protein n=1 Tax=Wickerhamomyces pijperi TaxID=599730 RepID=A0A9P8TIN9_WICPI|nr:hypothetical protein WICPIJ_008515 [Wickerhamomyces pijperi]